MSALVESIFYTSNEENQRFVPWHGIGTAVEEAPDSKTAITLAGLDWNVKKEPVYVNGNVVPGYVANVRDKDNTVLGVVTPKYKIVQNSDAFEFTDNLIGGNVKYETAGSLRNGKSVWLLAKLPSTKILGDDVDSFVCFSNTHDGTGAVRVCMTPIRVVCNNTLNLALSTAKRSWSVRHMGDISSKMAEARETLELAEIYMEELSKEADILANENMTDDEVMTAIYTLFPITDDMSNRQKRTVWEKRNGIIRCYNADDIKQFKNTKYGIINAVTDFAGHSSPARETSTYRMNNWGRIMNGHPDVDRMYDILKAA